MKEKMGNRSRETKITVKNQMEILKLNIYNASISLDGLKCTFEIENKRQQT